ncbi:MAG: hypothetical protein K2Z81_08705 [Cyanobacteria bacterium]|nr:hypothetical protein [Cyanobacteriota bacterium]
MKTLNDFALQILNFTLFGGSLIACTTLLVIHAPTILSAVSHDLVIGLKLAMFASFALFLASLTNGCESNVTLPRLVRLSIRTSALSFSVLTIFVASSIGGTILICTWGGNPPKFLGETAFRTELLFGKDFALRNLHMLAAAAMNHSRYNDAEYYLKEAARLTLDRKESVPKESWANYSLMLDAVNIGNFELAESFYTAWDRQDSQSWHLATLAAIKEGQGNLDLASQYHMQCEIPKGSTNYDEKYFSVERIRRIIANIPQESKKVFFRVAGKNVRAPENFSLSCIDEFTESDWPALSRTFLVIDTRSSITDHRRVSNKGHILLTTKWFISRLSKLSKDRVAELFPRLKRHEFLAELEEAIKHGFEPEVQAMPRGFIINPTAINHNKREDVFDPLTMLPPHLHFVDEGQFKVLSSVSVK